MAGHVNGGTVAPVRAAERRAVSSVSRKSPESEFGVRILMTWFGYGI